ncbi:hypothetical protein LPJ73_004704 [Coemansia sp. RSA 2703]|nr:hypothetical protein LPJ73_004704 [Coemansia sp. RSA 2703]
MSSAATAKTDNTIADSNVFTKYKAAAEVANAAISKVISACKEGSKIIDLCKLGDASIEVGLGSQYSKKKGMAKGISYPTSISVNNIVCHFSPGPNDVNADQALKNGDVVRVQLGAHIDGYASVAGDTVVVGASEENPVTGKAADAIAAAHYAAEATLRLLKPGNRNMTVTDTVQKITDAFGCRHIENILSHEQKHNDLNGEKQIIFNPAPAQRQAFAQCEIGSYEVYLIDIFITTGEGRTKKSELRTTVYNKTGGSYKLKMKTARAAFKEISNSSTNFPFALRSFEDERAIRLGLIECVKSGLVQAYDIQEEKAGETVAQVTFTALVTPNGVHRITHGAAFNEKVVKTDKKIEDASVNELLASSTKFKAPAKK